MNGKTIAWLRLYMDLGVQYYRLVLYQESTGNTYHTLILEEKDFQYHLMDRRRPSEAL